jgi:hypothetical protein
MELLFDFQWLARSEAAPTYRVKAFMNVCDCSENGPFVDSWLG